MSAASSAPAHRRRDLLRLPWLRPILLWKHNRTVVQTALFLLAAIMVVDGLLGSPLAAKNTATVAAWVHYRGLIVVALLLAGNLFCAGCPFLLPRKLARWIGRPAKRWPRALRNKWVALAGLLGILFLYELFDLWASPWLTAWVIVAYFAAAFAIDREHRQIGDQQIDDALAGQWQRTLTFELRCSVLFGVLHDDHHAAHAGNQIHRAAHALDHLAGHHPVG